MNSIIYLKTVLNPNKLVEYDGKDVTSEKVWDK